ncbi:mannosyltransferase putative-domain-containing protein [Chytriomyces sp. MP71]|nr:mannosyltransferase putative-domain-containing protein [Chytriomyces sp. MP71]
MPVCRIRCRSHLAWSAALSAVSFLLLAWQATVWPAQAESRSVIKPPTDPMRPRIVYWNHHQGTAANVGYVMAHLNLSLSTFAVTSDHRVGYQAKEKAGAEKLVASGWVRDFCSQHDVIIIGDTLPFARPLLESLLAANTSFRCHATIIIELTQRFDWGISDTDAFYKTIFATAPFVHWVQNNPFEARNLADQTFATPPFRFLRPVGHSTVLALNPISDHDATLVAVFSDGKDWSPLRYIMEHLRIPHKVLTRKYGGPRALAHYRASIEIPYQVSTMKIYENCAAGVVQYWPTPDFFKELALKDYMWFLATKEVWRTGPDLERYMDYFHSDLEPFVYRFGSWQELADLLKEGADADPRRVRENGPKMWEEIRMRSLFGWAWLLMEVGVEVRLDGNHSVDFQGLPKEPPQSVSLMKQMKAPVDVDEYEIALTEAKVWKEKLWQDGFEKQRHEYTRLQLSSLDLGSQQYRRYMYEDPPAPKTLVDMEPKFDGMDNGLVATLDWINGKENADQSTIVKYVESMLEMMESVTSQFTSMSPTCYRCFAMLSRSIKIADSILHNNHYHSVKNVSYLINRFSTRLQSVASNATQIVYPWLLPSKLPFNSLQEIPSAFNQSRGIVLVIQDDGFARARSIIHHLRQQLKCNLPIEVFHDGDKLGIIQRQALMRLKGVDVRDLQPIFPGYKEDIDSTEHSKPFAILSASFQQVFYIHQDQVLLQSPETFLDHPNSTFKTYGMLLLQGPIATNEKPYSTSWLHWFIGGYHLLSTAAVQTRYARNLTRHELDASILAFDKSRLNALHALLAACHLNRRHVRDGTLAWFTDANAGAAADRELWWMGAEVERTPFEFWGGSFGVLHAMASVGEGFACGGLVFRDREGNLTHVNAKEWGHKLRGKSIYWVMDETLEIQAGGVDWCIDPLARGVNVSVVDPLVSLKLEMFDKVDQDLKASG